MTFNSTQDALADRTHFAIQMLDVNTKAGL
jgi:hypothetical protein